MSRFSFGIAYFASFLKISVNQTSAVIELLLGAVLLSLLIAPRLIERFPNRHLATVLCLTAASASFGLAIVFWLAPSVATREAVVIVLFPLLGMSLASLAPLAQHMTGWAGPNHAKLLTGVWTVAFLITPQLIRAIAPRYGLDLFFAAFALTSLSLIPAVWMVQQPSPATPRPAQDQHAKQSLFPIVLVLVTFEAMTMLVTLSGITSRATQGAALAFLGAVGYLIVDRKSGTNRGRKSGGQVERTTLAVFVFLFLVNIATTGFYDTAYLLEHMCSNTLIANRATLGALAQVVAVLAATAVLARFGLQRSLMFAGQWSRQRGSAQTCSTSTIRISGYSSAQRVSPASALDS